MKPILTDLNLFGKRIFDVHTLEVTGEPTSDRHVITRLKGQILANLARDEAITQANLDIADAVSPLVTQAVYDAAIAAIQAELDLTKPIVRYFINENTLSYDWPDSGRRPLVEVFILNSTQTIEGSSVTVTDNATHKYSGEYNTVGSVCINSSGDWTVQHCYYNCYKKSDADWYVVVNQATQTWQIIEAENPHTSVGEKAASTSVNLGSLKSLPYSFGDYIIDPNFDSIDSLEFLKGDVGVQYDDVSSRVLINFNGANPSGYVVMK
ncbi:hypothetical protein VPH5P1C_0016 [Vibrio phage 5P1c]|nr:hypothetical protein VP495E541_P0016 [Vibrio phage 495E54-1]CAH9011844.1 hypothetical protein VP496E541_P0016 [Vibrio phage 496E54-1]